MRIADLQHRVALCSQRDRIEDGSFEYGRHLVAESWAHIDQRSSSSWSAQGANISGGRSSRTHIITMRYRWDLSVSAMAWIYEKPRRSEPRWFKVLRVGKTEKAGNAYFQFDCKLVERSDDSVEPLIETPARQNWIPNKVKF